MGIGLFPSPTGRGWIAAGVFASRRGTGEGIFRGCLAAFSLFARAMAVIACVPLLFAGAATSASSAQLLVAGGNVGPYGGRITVAERTEPKTLNPVTAADLASLDVIRRMNADLIHINCRTQRTEPSLAAWWRVSPDGRRYTITLRQGVRFSDGHPLTADDVVFSFMVYLDPKIHAPQRDMLMVGGEPIRVRKIGAYTLEFDLAQPYAAAERLFDSVFILPRHLLAKAYEQGKLRMAWALNTSPGQIAGLGAFRFKAYVPGERLVLERNPYYWKVDRAGDRLPYLNEIDFLFAANEEVQAMRFEAGETDVVNDLNPQDFSALKSQQQARSYRVYDLGPGLEYDFLFFNLNDLSPEAPPEALEKQRWFRKVKFRQAVSTAIDRQAIVRLVYRGRATPIWSNVTPGNKLWIDSALPKPAYSLARARSLLESAGFRWDKKGNLRDQDGETVRFSVVTSAGNILRTQIATILQSDLAKLGMNVQVVPLEFHSVVDRVFKTHDYDACLLGLISGDADPNPEMNVWLSNGSMHLWNLGERHPETPWEAEIDRLMRKQATTLNFEVRKRLYDRVQLLIEEYLPLICVVSPDVLVGAKTGLGNFRPAILGDYTLWNADQLFWKNRQRPASQ
jgi:peptide/nickel transport system substrate-binding protein